MPVNEALATYSDYAFRTAIVIYLAAMLLYLGEYARIKAPKQLVTVGAGDEVPEQAGAARRPWTERFGRMAVAMTVLGALLHAGSVATRGLAVDRWPWGNMYEFSSAITLFAVLAWLIVLRRNPGIRRVGAFLLLPVVILMFLGGTALYAQAGPVVPALHSYWLAIHVTAVSLATGMLTVAGVASALFLVRRFGGGDDRSGGFVASLPASDALDRVAYRVTVIAFPLYTFAIMAGAIWAEAAWGRFWGWDPKETVAFVAWVAYACYLHARATAGWRTGRAAWINVVGLVAVLFNLFFVNLVVAGLHSYAGVG